MQAMVIQGTEIQIKEYMGRRVVTFKDIDTVHQRPLGTASRNFRENRERFISGIDFYKVNQPDEIRRLGITRPQGGTPSETTLITESGYLMLVKSFTDDLAWKVQAENGNVEEIPDVSEKTVVKKCVVKQGVPIDISKMLSEMNSQNVTVRELAERANVSPATIGGWIAGVHEPVLQNRINVCVALGKDKDFLTPKRTRRVQK